MRRLFVVSGLIVAFALGTATGYAARTINSPAAPTGHLSAACPQGTHAVVWYTARTWECAANS